MPSDPLPPAPELSADPQLRASNFRDALSWLRSILIYNNLIYLYTLVLGAVSLLVSFFDRDGNAQHALARLWSRMILKTIGSHVRVTGLNTIDATRAHVYAVNHLSALDVPVLYASLPFPFRIIAKKELFSYPILGSHLRRSGQIAVDRASPRASMRSLHRAVDELKAGMPLVIFPEGGRSYDGDLQAFMSGAFYVAIKAQVDVVPMAIVGTFEMLPINTFHIRPRPVELRIGSGISSAGMSLHNMDSLTADVERAIRGLQNDATASAKAEPPPAAPKV